MRITWEANGDEFPTRWDSNCVRLKDNGPMWFGRIKDSDGLFILEVWRGAAGTCHFERCPTLAEAKRRGAEVLRALCGGPALKGAVVWCGVTPKGRVMPETISIAKWFSWREVLFQSQQNGEKAAEAEGYTVRKFRIEEVR